VEAADVRAPLLCISLLHQKQNKKDSNKKKRQQPQKLVEENLLQDTLQCNRSIGC
jgi:hypothetical protein